MSGLDPIPEENMAWDSYYRLYYEDDDDENDPENNYTYTTPPNMAEGGYDPTDPTTSKTPSSQVMMMTIMSGVTLTCHYTQFQRKKRAPTPRTPLNQGLHQHQLVAKTYQWPQGSPPRDKGAGTLQRPLSLQGLIKGFQAMTQW